MTTEDPGGDGQVTWTVVYFDTDEDAIQLPPDGALVTVADLDGIYWRGRLEEPTMDVIQIDGVMHGIKASFIARGYGSALDDRVYPVSQVWLAGTPTQEIFAEIIAQAGGGNVFTTPPLLGAANVLVNDSEDALGQSGQTLVNRYCKIGNPDFHELTWGVREYQGAAYFECFERDTPPETFIVAASDCISAPISWPLQWVKNGVVIKWSQGVWFVDDPESISSLNGTERDLYIDATNTVGDLGTAQYIASSVLQEMKDVRPFGRNIEIDYDYGDHSVVGNGGLYVPPWRVRAGRNLRITGMDSGQDKLPMTDLFIKSTHWDEDARKLTITTEQVQSLAQIIGRATTAENKIPDKVLPDSPSLPSGTNPGPSSPFATLDKNGKVNDSVLPEGWDLVSLNFCMNGGGNPITDGVQQGWLGLDYNVGVERVTIIGTSDPTMAANCAISLKIWHDDGIETLTNPPIPGEYFTQNDGATTVFELNGGVRATFAMTKMVMKADSIWGIEVTDDLSCTAVVADVWITGRRQDTGKVNISPAAPIISGLSVTVGINGVAILTWDTDTLSDSQVQYGTDTNYGSWTYRDGTVSFDTSMPPIQHHNATIQGLISGQTYFAKVLSVDYTGRQGTVVMIGDDLVTWTQ